MEPERGFIVAVLGSDVDPDEELGEFRELSRTAGVEPVGEVVSSAPARPASYVGKGKLDGALAAVQAMRAPSRCSSTTTSLRLQQRKLEDALPRASSTGRS